MIITTLDEISQQSQLSNEIKSAIEFLKNHGTEKRDLGKFEFADGKLFGFAQAYATSPENDDTRFEAHRNYIDVQYISSGEETMKLLHIDELTVTQEYAEEADCLLGISENNTHDDIAFKSGQVMILYPTDAHAPGVASKSGTHDVKKLCIKIPVR